MLFPLWVLVTCTLVGFFAGVALVVIVEREAILAYEEAHDAE